MTNLRPHVGQIIAFLKRPKTLLSLTLLGVTLLLGLGLILLEYQTNVFATHLGRLLVKTNPMRPQVGNIWQRIESQTRTRETIDETETLSLNDIQKGLPEPIYNNRFESEIIPNTGIPSYVSIWKTPMPHININDRSLNDIIISRRIYQRGLAVLNALTLPDVHFHNPVRMRVEQLYTHFDDLHTLATDTLIAEGDTLSALTPDSLKAAVFQELATEMIPTLKKAEQNRLIRRYQEGHLIQLFLYRDLGRYRGELYDQHAPETPIPFTLSTHDVARIFQFTQPDSTHSE